MWLLIHAADQDQGLYSPHGLTSYQETSWSLDAARFGFKIIQSQNSPHKGQWCGALMFSLICVWINGWVNNREAGDLRRPSRSLWRHFNAHRDRAQIFVRSELINLHVFLRFKDICEFGPDTTSYRKALGSDGFFMLYPQPIVHPSVFRTAHCRTFVLLTDRYRPGRKLLQAGDYLSRV